jgi:hypothetical protein
MEAVELADEVGEQGDREGVAAVGAVEREQGDAGTERFDED